MLELITKNASTPVQLLMSSGGKMPLLVRFNSVRFLREHKHENSFPLSMVFTAENSDANFEYLSDVGIYFSDACRKRIALEIERREVAELI